MESDAGVGKLLELIFGKNATISDEMVEQYSISSNLVTEDFSKKLALVFRVKKRIVFLRQDNFSDGHYRQMLSSKSRYLIHVIYACLYENESIQNAFDSFISVCALTMHLNEEIFAKTGLYFSDLNPDIVMAFYQNVLKKSFLELGGISQFVKYIRNHKYLRWNEDEKDPLLFNDPTSVFFEPDLNENTLKKLAEFDVFALDKNHELSKTIRVLVKQILSTKSVKFPPLPTESDLIMKMVAYRKKEKTKNAEGKRLVESASTNATSHGDSKTNSVGKEQKNIAWFENIIQAVTRYNHSKHSGPDSAKSQTQEEAREILDHLKNKINYLTEILDKCENE